MPKDVKEEEVVIPPAPEPDKPPEGISQEDWDDLSQAEKEGVKDTDEPEEDIPAEELEKIVEEKPPETPPAEKPPETPPEKPPEVPPETPENIASFRAVVADSELPPVDAVPDDMQDKLDELDEKFDAEELTRAEYNKSRDAINRQIVMQNIQARDAAKGQLTWEKEQQFFLKSKPEYLGKDLKSSAMFGALGEAVKSLGTDPKYAAASGIELLIAADKAVKEAFGITATPPAKPPEKPEEKPPAPLPQHKTLGDVPPAAPNTTEGVWSALDKLTGEAYEDALSKLTPEQQDRYLASR